MKQFAVDYLTYYYNTGTEPFRSLSVLPDGEAVRVMESLYRKYKQNILFERFKDPARYLQDRRKTEEWVRAGFIEKGGRPREAYPICMVLGSSRWIERNAPDARTHGTIRIPLSSFADADVSFTLPDSMVSRWFAEEKPAAYFQLEYHGRIFTRTEILGLVEEKGLPEEHWQMALPPGVGFYIEAQVWNHQPLERYKTGRAPE
jgi:hypothetical protein